MLVVAVLAIPASHVGAKPLAWFPWRRRLGGLAISLSRLIISLKPLQGCGGSRIRRGSCRGRSCRSGARRRSSWFLNQGPKLFQLREQVLHVLKHVALVRASVYPSLLRPAET